MGSEILAGHKRSHRKVFGVQKEDFRKKADKRFVRWDLVQHHFWVLDERQRLEAQSQPSLHEPREGKRRVRSEIDCEEEGAETPSVYGFRIAVQTLRQDRPQ